MYEPSRHVDSFFIAGFQHYDGALVLGNLQVGSTLSFEAEPDNPHDPEAVVLEWHGTKLGYVPSDSNHLISLLTYFGSGNALEMRVLQVSPENDPWKQVRVGVFVADRRPGAASV